MVILEEPLILLGYLIALFILGILLVSGKRNKIAVFFSFGSFCASLIFSLLNGAEYKELLLYSLIYSVATIFLFVFDNGERQ